MMKIWSIIPWGLPHRWVEDDEVVDPTFEEDNDIEKKAKQLYRINTAALLFKVEAWVPDIITWVP